MDRGHRAAPHTADVMIEAWAPTRPGCFEEAVAALAGVFADAGPAAATETIGFQLGPAPDDELLVLLLEEAIYVVDVGAAVPVAATIEADGQVLRGRFAAVPSDAVEEVGAVPKAVSRHGLSFGASAGMWVARAVIDV